MSTNMTILTNLIKELSCITKLELERTQTREILISLRTIGSKEVKVLFFRRKKILCSTTIVCLVPLTKRQLLIFL